MTADDHDDPATALGEIWEALDSLPRSTPSPAATATTVEMVAIAAQHRSLIAARPAPLAWIAAGALVTVGFLGGLVAGRASLPVRPLPGRPFADRERPVTERERPVNGRERSFNDQARPFNNQPRPFNDQGRPPRRGPLPREEIPAPPR